MIPCDSYKVLCVIHWIGLPEEARDLSPLYNSPARIWGQPSSYAMGTLVQFAPGVNQPESKVSFSPPSIAKVKNAWRYIFTTQYVSMTFKRTSLLLCNKRGLGFYRN